MSIASDDNRCAETSVRDSGRWPSYHHCYNRGVETEDGKLWCRIHTPSRVRERREKADAASQMRFEQQMRPFRELDKLRAQNRDLLAALEAIIEHGDWDAATCSRCQTITTQARAAIDAAKGETK